MAKLPPHTVAAAERITQAMNDGSGSINIKSICDALAYVAGCLIACVPEDDQDSYVERFATNIAVAVDVGSRVPGKPEAWLEQ